MSQGPPARCELAVRGGTVVNHDGSAESDLGITGGRIVQLGGVVVADDVIDARGCLVLPGAIDLHVHLSAEPPEPGSPNGFVDDFDSGSRAAAAGGVTTIGQMSFAEDGWELAAAVDRDLRAAARDSLVDYLVHPGLVEVTEHDLALLPGLAAAGHTSLKIVSPTFGGSTPAAIRAVEEAGANGMLTLIHCEDQDLITAATERLRRTGRLQMAHFAASRPPVSERAAVEWAVAVCEVTGSPMVLVHLSSSQALAVAAAARGRGLPVFVETRPMYLHLTDAVFAGERPGRYTGMPPVRSGADVEALWQGIADGAVHTLASDHAPWRLADKVDPELDVAGARMGVADLETLLPMAFSAGVATGRIPPERLVQVTSTNAARLYGLYPRKGTIAVGSDADLVVLDPNDTRVVDGSAMQSRAGYSVYDGISVTGWPRFTLSRGEPVWADGRIVAAGGRGRWIRRDPTPGRV